MSNHGLEFFDSHCHLTAERFGEDRHEVVSRAHAAGVTRMTVIASHLADAQNVAELVRGTRDLWGTAGVHPHDAASQGATDLSRIRELLQEEERLVAVGETGLDYFYDHSPRAEQRTSFMKQIELAAELDLPLIVHCREADADMSAILRDLPPGVQGVLHCFVGSDELLDAGLDADWYVSFTGLVTFKKFDGVDGVRRVPDDRLMVETDAPYLAPVPHRGRRNEPAFIPRICEALAVQRSQDLTEIARLTTANAVRFYGLEAAT